MEEIAEEVITRGCEKGEFNLASAVRPTQRSFKRHPTLSMAELIFHSSSALRCVVVTPETTVLDAMADFVALPLFDGEVGFARAALR